MPQKTPEKRKRRRKFARLFQENAGSCSMRPPAKIMRNMVSSQPAKHDVSFELRGQQSDNFGLLIFHSFDRTDGLEMKVV